MIYLLLFSLWACSILYAVWFSDAEIPLLFLMVVVEAWYIKTFIEAAEE